LCCGAVVPENWCEKHEQLYWNNLPSIPFDRHGKLLCYPWPNFIYHSNVVLAFGTFEDRFEFRLSGGQHTICPCIPGGLVLFRRDGQLVETRWHGPHLPGCWDNVHRRKKMLNPKLSILISILLAVIAQLYFKKGVQSYPSIDKHGRLYKMMRSFFGGYIISGLLIYGLSTIFWLIALSKLELSYAFPFMSLALVGVSVSAVAFHGEKLSLYRKLGIGIICIGILLIAQS
jgi:multidrug transporter EmrE-like cation transporter